MIRSGVFGVAAKSTRRWGGRKSAFRVIGETGSGFLLSRFPTTPVRAMARGFGRHPQLLGSTSLDGGETSGGRFEGEWTEYGFSVLGNTRTMTSAD